MTSLQTRGEGGGIAPTKSQPDNRRGWVVSTMLRPLYPRERPDTHCTGDWVGFGAGLDGTEKLAPHQNSIPWPFGP
jgi:hypothetical protein